MCFSSPKSNAAKDTTPEYEAPADSESFVDGKVTRTGGTRATVRSGANAQVPMVGIGGSAMPASGRRTSAALGL